MSAKRGSSFPCHFVWHAMSVVHSDTSGPVFNGEWIGIEPFCSGKACVLWLMPVYYTPYRWLFGQDYCT